MFGVRHIWLQDRAGQRPLSFNRYSTIRASFGIAGPGPWHTWAWHVRMLCGQERRKARTLIALGYAIAAYKDFLTLWKDADPDIPIYKQAKAEYAQLK